MRWTLLLLPVLLIAASPAPQVDALIRQGNTAFANKDYAAALRFYGLAETRTTDPGLVAGNKASALYQLALATRLPSSRVEYFREAERHYRCAAEGADDPRRLRARFGLANSILQGRIDEALAVKEAIAAYRDCLNNPALDEGTAADARHNLEAAKLQLLRLQSKPREPEKPNEGSDDNPPKDPKKPEPNKTMNGEEPTKGMGTPRATEIPAEVKDGQKPKETKQTTPGSGNLKTIFDESPSPPLSAKEAEDVLERAVKRIQDEQLTKRYRSSSTPTGSVKDW